MESYYKQKLEKLGINLEDIKPSIKVAYNEKESGWMQLDKDTIKVLIEFLEKLERTGNN